MRTKWHGVWLAVAMLALTMTARSAEAADFRLEVGTTAAGTSWRGDAATYGHLKLAFRFFDLFGPYGQGHLGYGVVDERLLTLLALGAQIWTPPLGPARIHGRLAFLHQHEESISVVAGDYASALFGIGDGIRHRAGGEAGLGVDLSLWTRNDFELFGAVDASAKLFPDDLGPLVYVGGGLHLGFNYTL
jgi:hypothetical protein